MANIKIISECPLYDGMPVTFRAPCDCTAVSGLTVAHGEESQTFSFADAHGNNLAGIGNLFATGAYVKAILNTVDGLAYLQNAATNAYIEGKLQAGMNYIPATVPDEIIFDEWKEYTNFPVDTASYNIKDLQYIDGAYYLLVQGKSSPYAIKLFKSEDKGNSWSAGKTLWEPTGNNTADRIFGVRGKICVTTCGASGTSQNFSRVYTMDSFEAEPVYKQIQDYAISVSRDSGYWKMANGYLFLISNTTTTPKMYAYNPETNTVLQSGGFNGASSAYIYDVCHYKDNIYLLSVKGSQGAPNVYRMTLDFASSTFSFTHYSYINSGGGWFIPVGDEILEVEWDSSSGFNGLYKITSVTESGYDEELLITRTQIGHILYAVKYRGKTLLFAEAVKVNDDKTAAYALVELSDDLKSFTVIKEYPNAMYSYLGRRTQVNYWPSFEPESVLTYSFWNYVNSSKVNGLAYTSNTYKVIPKIVDYHGADVVLPSAQLDVGGKIAVGSYVGTGTYGAGKDTVLSFDFAPKAVMIYATRYHPNDGNRVYNFLGGRSNASNEVNALGIDMANIGTSYNPSNSFLYDGVNLQPVFFKKSADGKTLYIYCTGSAAMQMNNAYTYVYIALG